MSGEWKRKTETDKARDAVRRRLAAFYTLEEVDRFLSSPCPLLEDQIANDLIERGEASRVHEVIQMMEDGVYL